MMKVFIAYTQENAQFVNKLHNDLTTRHFDVQTTLPHLDNITTEIARTDVVLIVLSDTLITDAAMLVYIETLKETERQIILLRVGAVSELPSVLGGLLPVNFSDENDYTESLDTLIEDLEPPTMKLPRETPLSNELDNMLNSDVAQDRADAIQRIGDKHTELDENQLQYVEEQLRRIAFRDENRGVKMIARSTLQLLSGQSSNTQITEPALEEAATEKIVPPSPQEAPPITIQPTNPEQIVQHATSEQSSMHPIKTMVVYSISWRLLPVFGILLALIQATIHRNALLGLPTALVWLIVPWFNVAIRDGGQLDWKMPGPLVGNGIIGLILGLLGSVLVLILSGLEMLDFMLITVLGMLYGIAIGWLSSLYIR